MIIKSVKIEKEKYHTIQEVGWSNADFYGYGIVNGKRMGTVWKFKEDGSYIFNEDFDRKVHSAARRPQRVKGMTLRELKENIEVYFFNWW